MKTLLYIDACVRGENSRTKRIADQLAAAAALRDDVELQTLTLSSMSIHPLTSETLTVRNDLLLKRQFDDPSLAIARQFASARGIIVAAPFWDLSFPSILRVYLEHIFVRGITFHYNRVGKLLGDCKALRMVYVNTRGGELEQPSFATADLATPYLRGVCEMLNIPHFNSISAVGLDIVTNDVELLLRQAETQANIMGADFWSKHD